MVIVVDSLRKLPEGFKSWRVETFAPKSSSDSYLQPLQGSFASSRVHAVTIALLALLVSIAAKLAFDVNSAKLSPQHLESMIVLDIASVELMARPRITVTVSEEVYDFLSGLADQEQRPLANLAAYLLTNAAKEYQRQKEAPSPKKAKGE
jgi:hypothetical protein